MAADPTDKVNVGAAIARAGSVLAASSHALQEGRSPSVGPLSFSILDLVDNDNKLPDDICDDNEGCVENLHANAVSTRAQRSVHFAPIMSKAGLYAYSVCILYYTLIRLYAYNFKIVASKRYH
jgi:hypothetical protein